ncbi:transcription termination factor MTERF9, chloroplastic-like isoform X1 [Magnolia sinica]|uniref:transcription termination factor MTERF9, chloroplastic-like isoform X1 n=1 Tax=Magnolia sinica TaxID=86752 RepID=UPI002658336D|nr:transcription termination factor MTERF9, chloroplastic-like isoform X1 [Magnolia sinica]
MFHFLHYRKLLQINIQTLQIQSLQNPFLKSHSQINPPPFLQYLKNSCGFSPEKALTVSKMRKRTPKSPDSVLTFFKSHGFSEAHIKSIINRILQLLFAIPKSSLSPKIQFFREKGLSESDIVGLIVSNPYILASSLERRIKPLFDFIRGFLGNDRFVIELLKRSMFRFNLQRLVSNVAVLKNCRVPNCHISRFLVKRPIALMMPNPCQFNDKVKMVTEMGFIPSTYMFVEAVYMTVSLSRSSWDMKFKVYRSLGWSDEEILLAFRKHPSCIMLSEEKIRKGIDFFVKELGWSTSYILSYPVLLSLSMETRVMPRYRFLQVLESKGLISNDTKKLAWSFNMSQKQFLEKYVMKHQAKVPEILNVYEAMIESKGLSIKNGEGYEKNNNNLLHEKENEGFGKV